jgi:hypothetical protein
MGIMILVTIVMVIIMIIVMEESACSPAFAIPKIKQSIK